MNKCVLNLPSLLLKEKLYIFFKTLKNKKEDISFMVLFPKKHNASICFSLSSVAGDKGKSVSLVLIPDLCYANQLISGRKHL